ncbi:MAG: hypothetical protein KJ062_03480, partial [Thermoanaerobaculia bacterium]|nr:hypothetical protein [Thermoanaerobaculia bacterium]
DLERFSSGSRDVRLVVAGLPAAMTHEWIDASTKARLSSFRFAEGQNGARVVLRVFVPADADSEWFGKLLSFRAEVRDGERAIGTAELQLRPVGAPRLALLVDNLLVVMDRSTPKEVALALENTGGVTARDVRVEADAPIGFEAAVTPSRLAVVAPGQRARIDVRLSAGPEAVPGEYNLKVRAVAVTRLANIVSPEQSFRLVLRSNGGWVYLGFGLPVVLAGFAVWWFLRRRIGRGAKTD